jgi:hypothetical protein
LPSSSATNVFLEFAHWPPPWASIIHFRLGLGDRLDHYQPPLEAPRSILVGLDARVCIRTSDTGACKPHQRDHGPEPRSEPAFHRLECRDRRGLGEYCFSLESSDRLLPDTPGLPGSVTLPEV